MMLSCFISIKYCIMKLSIFHDVLKTSICLSEISICDNFIGGVANEYFNYRLWNG